MVAAQQLAVVFLVASQRALLAPCLPQPRRRTVRGRTSRLHENAWAAVVALRTALAHFLSPGLEWIDKR